MYHISVSKREAMLIDWILTMHTWDTDVLGRLITRYDMIRFEAAKVLLGESLQIELEENETTDEFIAMIPIIFLIDGENVGLSLKTKLYSARYQLGGDRHDSSKDEAVGSAESSPYA